MQEAVQLGFRQTQWVQGWVRYLEFAKPQALKELRQRRIEAPLDPSLVRRGGTSPRAFYVEIVDCRCKQRRGYPAILPSDELKQGFALEDQELRIQDGSG